MLFYATFSNCTTLHFVEVEKLDNDNTTGHKHVLSYLYDIQAVHKVMQVI